MTWLIWRQHRNQAAIALAALVVFVVVVAITGVHMAGTYHSALHSCGATDSCNSIGDNLFSGDGAIIDIVNLSVVVPLLISLFWGAPLLAREIEEGTHKLVWTQSVSRRHWFASKTAALMGATVLLSTVVTIAATWWERTFDLVDHNRFQSGHFDVIGIVPVAYAIFGAALGLAVGSLLRRTLPALAATVAVTVALRVAIANYVRPHYLAALTKVVTFTAASTGIGGSSWTLHTTVVDASGRNVNQRGGLFATMPSACRSLVAGPARRDQVLSCLDAHGFRQRIVYQPANRFWTFQGIEAAIFVVLAVGLVVTAFSVLGRDA